jgi:hypothetical protein
MLRKNTDLDSLNLDMCWQNHSRMRRYNVVALASTVVLGNRAAAHARLPSQCSGFFRRFKLLKTFWESHKSKFGKK